MPPLHEVLDPPLLYTQTLPRYCPDIPPCQKKNKVSILGIEKQTHRQTNRPKDSMKNYLPKNAGDNYDANV